MSRVERLFMRFVLLFLRVEPTECGHGIVVVTRFGWYALAVFMALEFLFLASR